MAKIDFGYNNDDQLNAQFEGYEYTADFEALVNINGSDFVIVNRNGKYDVTEVLQDVYVDGSYSTYGNQLTTKLKAALLTTLNATHFYEKIQSGMSVVDALKYSAFEVMPSKLRPIITGYENLPGVVTSIKAELFEDLKNTQRFNHSSFYDMSKEIEMLRAQIEELEQSKGL